jgi:hypothetical protein
MDGAARSNQTNFKIKPTVDQTLPISPFLQDSAEATNISPQCKIHLMDFFYLQQSLIKFNDFTSHSFQTRSFHLFKQSLLRNKN